MIIKYFTRIARSTATFRSEQLAREDLHPRHYTYLLMACMQPGLSQDEFTKEIMLNKSSVARQLQMLEEKGYIERKISNNDKRVMEVYPSQKSLDLFPSLKLTNETWNQFLLEGFSEAETAQLVSYLTRVSDNAAKHLLGMRLD